jgi:hypothetical protein
MRSLRRGSDGRLHFGSLTITVACCIWGQPTFTRTSASSDIKKSVVPTINLSSSIVAMISRNPLYHLALFAIRVTFIRGRRSCRFYRRRLADHVYRLVVLVLPPRVETSVVCNEYHYHGFTSFSLSSMLTVSSQSTHASVIDTPCFKAIGPSGGMSCLPALICDSIITPVIDLSPEASCEQMSFKTIG